MHQVDVVAVAVFRYERIIMTDHSIEFNDPLLDRWHFKIYGKTTSINIVTGICDACGMHIRDMAGGIKAHMNSDGTCKFGSKEKVI